MWSNEKGVVLMKFCANCHESTQHPRVYRNDIRQQILA
jgi:hypothetical protein